MAQGFSPCLHFTSSDILVPGASRARQKPPVRPSVVALQFIAPGLSKIRKLSSFCNFSSVYFFLLPLLLRFLFFLFFLRKTLPCSSSFTLYSLSKQTQTRPHTLTRSQCDRFTSALHTLSFSYLCHSSSPPLTAFFATLRA